MSLILLKKVQQTQFSDSLHSLPGVSFIKKPVQEWNSQVDLAVKGSGPKGGEEQEKING